MNAKPQNPCKETLKCFQAMNCSRPLAQRIEFDLTQSDARPFSRDTSAIEVNN